MVVITPKWGCVIKIKYIGGRSTYEVSLNRKAYYFTKENGRVTDIQDKNIINYIFGLPNRAEFEVVMPEKEIQEKLIEKNNPLECEICGFIAKSEFGISVHKRKHLKQGV